MAQHDYLIDNASGAVVRADINDALSAIVTNNSGSTAPDPSFAHQWWADTSSGILKQRDAANTTWLEVASFDDGAWVPYHKGAVLLPFEEAGDILVSDAGGLPVRLAVGTTGRHIRAGSGGPEYGGDVDMASAQLVGNAGGLVAITGATDLHATNHLARDLDVRDATLTIPAQGSEPANFGSNWQAIVGSSHADGGALAVPGGVTLNGVAGGSATLERWQAFGLFRLSENAWWLMNADVTAP